MRLLERGQKCPAAVGLFLFLFLLLFLAIPVVRVIVVAFQDPSSGAFTLVNFVDYPWRWKMRRRTWAPTRVGPSGASWCR